MAEKCIMSPCSASSSHQMMQCCRCDMLLDDPQLLRCLHSCCRSCVEQIEEPKEASGCSSTLTATCPICEETSETSSNAFIDSTIRRHKAISSASTCGMCDGTADGGEAVHQAEVWCTACLQSFCATCTLWHGRFYRAHATIELRSVQNWDAVSPSSAPSCASHHKAFHVACFTCRACKCPDCWTSCCDQQHNVKPLGSPAVARRIQKVKQTIDILQQEILKRAEVLNPRINIDEDLRVSLEGDLEKLKRRKLRLFAEIDTACLVAEQRLRDAYDVLRAKAIIMSRTAATTERKVRQATDYGHYVVQADIASELLNQEKALTERMTALSAELQKLKWPLAVSECIAFESTLPDDDDQMAQLATSWIGTPLVTTDDLCSRSQVQKLPSTAAIQATTVHAIPFTTVLLPTGCRDVSATEDGRLLLAAGEAGLLEYSLKSSGQLSHWPAPTTRNGQSNAVLSVEALRDGRVAVGVAWDRLVVLLRRVGVTDESEATWLEENRIQSLPGPPLSLSVHDDVLLVASAVGSSGLLTLVSLSSGWQTCSFKCDYIVASVALTDLLIFTASSGAVKLGDGRRAYLVEAHMRTSDQRLWRCDLGNRSCTILWNICVDAVGRRLQVTACLSENQSDPSDPRLITISSADGSVLHSDSVDVNLRTPLDKLLVTRSGQRVVLVASCASVSGAIKTWASLATR